MFLVATCFLTYGHMLPSNELFTRLGIDDVKVSFYCISFYVSLSYIACIHPYIMITICRHTNASRYVLIHGHNHTRMSNFFNLRYYGVTQYLHDFNMLHCCRYGHCARRFPKHLMHSFKRQGMNNSMDAHSIQLFSCT